MTTSASAPWGKFCQILPLLHPNSSQYWPSPFFMTQVFFSCCLCIETWSQSVHEQCFSFPLPLAFPALSPADLHRNHGSLSSMQVHWAGEPDEGLDPSPLVGTSIVVISLSLISGLSGGACSDQTMFLPSSPSPYGLSLYSQL